MRGAGRDRHAVAQPGVLERVVGVPRARVAGQRAAEPEVAARPAARCGCAGSRGVSGSVSASLRPAAVTRQESSWPASSSPTRVARERGELDRLAVAQPLVGRGVGGPPLVIPAAARAGRDAADAQIAAQRGQDAVLRRLRERDRARGSRTPAAVTSHVSSVPRSSAVTTWLSVSAPSIGSPSRVQANAVGYGARSRSSQTPREQRSSPADAAGRRSCAARSGSPARGRGSRRSTGSAPRGR